MACATSVVKFLVFLFNLLCALAGLGFIAIGVLSKVGLKIAINTQSAGNRDGSIDAAINAISIIIIALGVIIFVISFFGCCGAIKESTCMLTTYAILLLVLFIIQVALGVYVFVQFKNKETDIKLEVQSALIKSYQQYSNSGDHPNPIDALQAAIKCCGVDGPMDWSKENWYKGGKIPPSCCGVTSNFACELENAFEDGCLTVFWNYLKKSLEVVGIVVIVIAAIEFFGAIAALYLVWSIRSKERKGY